MLIGSTDKLSDIFKRIGYQLDGVRRHGEVPRLFLATLPRDLSTIQDKLDSLDALRAKAKRETLAILKRH